MMLDSIKDKLNIYGFDISSEVIEDAKSGDCQLIRLNKSYSTGLDSEDMLFDDANDLSEYQRKCRDKFRQYYTPKGAEYRVPVFPNAKQELKDLEECLSEPEEFEKQKKQYDEQIQKFKEEQPEIAEFIPSISFEDLMEEGKKVLKKQTEVYNIVRDFDTDMSLFGNCSFAQCDVMNLDKLYKPNSVNVLLYRNALYHSLCQGDNMFRYMKDGSENIMDGIAKQMNKILKPQGLVVFGEDEGMQGINKDIIKEIMENNGFRLLQEDDADNIWMKVEDIEKE